MKSAAEPYIFAVIEFYRTAIKAYSYEVTEIELLGTDGESVVLSSSQGNSISAAKLLQGVEKSYDPGVKLLEASEKSGEVQSGEAAMRGHGAAGV